MLNLVNDRPPAFFNTERLHVRRYRLTDAEDLHQAARSSIKEVFPFLPWCYPNYSLKDAIEYLPIALKRWDDESEFSFAIYSSDQKDYLGGCSLGILDEHPVANLGYWISTSASGMGVATEAVKGLSDYGFTRLGLQRIEILMSVHNQASKRVAEKSGAVYEGRMRNRLRLHHQNHDAFLYSLVPPNPVP